MNLSGMSIWLAKLKNTIMLSLGNGVIYAMFQKS